MKHYPDIAQSTNLMSYNYKKQRKIIIFEDLVQAKLRAHFKERSSGGKAASNHLSKFITGVK